MRVSDARDSNEKRDAFYVVAPLNCLLRFFALNCIYRDGSRLKQSWSITKNIFFLLIFGIINAFGLYNKSMTIGVRIYTFKNMAEFFFIFDFLQYFVQLIYVHKYGRNIALEYYTMYNYIDKALNVTSFSECRRRIINLIVWFTAITASSSALDYAAWYINTGSTISVTYGIDYMYVILRNLNLADIIAQVIQVEYRLEVLGNVLENFCVIHHDLPVYMKYVITDQSRLKQGKLNEIEISDRNKFDIAKLCECYLLILEQCDYINKTYGVRILGMCFNILIDMISSSNYAIRILVGLLSISNYYKVFLIASNCIWISACTAVLFYELYKCEQCYKQVRRIIRYTDSLLISKRITHDTRSTLKRLRTLAKTRPVRFHAVNFYMLDYSLLLSMASVVVTYTIILLQNLT